MPRADSVSDSVEPLSEHTSPSTDHDAPCLGMERVDYLTTKSAAQLVRADL